jgi:hypothetical protein
MATIQTFTDIKNRLSALLDDESTDFYTTTDRETAVNAAYFELYDMACRNTDGQGVEATIANLTVVAGTATAALPSGTHKVINIFYKESEDETYEWVAISPAGQHVYRSKIDRDSKQLAYYMRGNNIVMVPTPNWSDATKVFIEYVPEATAMTAGTDEPTSVPLMHRELIAYEAFIRLKEKEGVVPIQTTYDKWRQLRAAFEVSMESRQLQRSRHLNGDPGYDYYEGGIF